MMKHLENDRIGFRCFHKQKSKQYILSPEEKNPILVFRAGTPIAELPMDRIVVSQDGEEIRATGRFFVTTETIDPYHIIFDIF